jgi:hypothetical protein
MTTMSLVKTFKCRMMNCAVLASWPATFLQGSAAATGVALINSVGSVGSLLGPVFVGKDPRPFFPTRPSSPHGVSRTVCASGH